MFKNTIMLILIVFSSNCSSQTLKSIKQIEKTHQDCLDSRGYMKGCTQEYYKQILNENGRKNINPDDKEKTITKGVSENETTMDKTAKSTESDADLTSNSQEDEEGWYKLDAEKCKLFICYGGGHDFIHNDFMVLDYNNIYTLYFFESDEFFSENPVDCPVRFIWCKAVNGDEVCFKIKCIKINKNELGSPIIDAESIYSSEKLF